MRLSKGFWQTYKEVPADAVVPSHQLMMRAGLLHKSGAGLYNYLPFGLKVFQKIEDVIREELNKTECYEVKFTVVTPGELWQESGRWDKMEGLMLRFKSKGEQDLCISPTNEEAATDVFRSAVKSYKNLPVTIYQINTKFRDEIRPRFGLMRAREFIMKDAYSFDIDKAGLDKTYKKLFDAYTRIYSRLGLDFFPVEADPGAMGDAGSQTHEFQAIAETGEDEIIFCEATGYAANVERAQTKRTNLKFSEDTNLKEVSTPGKATITDVCDFLKTPEHHSLKSLVYQSTIGDETQLVLVLLLGDDELNEIKLKNFLRAEHLLPATDNELEEAEFVKGFIGPHKLSKEVKILIDSNVDISKGYVAGANKKDLHYTGLVPDRDSGKFEQADLRLSKKGDQTLDGKGIVDIKRGIEVGHIFQLGDKYSKAMNVTVLDKNGKAVNPLMGCYGLGVTRVAAAIVEQNHDDKGIIWPSVIAPAQVHFVSIAKSDESKKLCDEIYQELLDAGVEVVYDDRNAGPGFKFKDADLLGLPLQLVFGERDYKDSKKLKLVVRRTGEETQLNKEEVIVKAKAMLGKL